MSKILSCASLGTQVQSPEPLSRWEIGIDSTVVLWPPHAHRDMHALLLTQHPNTASDDEDKGNNNNFKKRGSLGPNEHHRRINSSSVSLLQTPAWPLLSSDPDIGSGMSLGFSQRL